MAEFVEAEIKYIVRGEQAVFWADRSRANPIGRRTRMSDADRGRAADHGQARRSTGTASCCSSGRARRGIPRSGEVQRVVHAGGRRAGAELTGAEKVLVFGTCAGAIARDDRWVAPGATAHMSIMALRTVRGFTRQALGDEADEWLQRRYMLINLWRPIARSSAPRWLCAMPARSRPRICSTARCAVGSAIPTAPSLWGYNLAYAGTALVLCAAHDPRRDFRVQAVRFGSLAACSSPLTAPSPIQRRHLTRVPRESIEVRTISFL